MSFPITIGHRVNSLTTTLLSEKLGALCGVTASYGAAQEWPVYDSNDFPQECVRLLRSFDITVEPPPNSDEENPGPIPQSQQNTGDVVIEDILGCYLSEGEIIVMFPRVITACARALTVSESVLYEVVLAHETAHALTHRGIMTKSFAWKSFSRATSESKELLAQLIPFVYFKRQELRSHLEVMELLSRHQRPKYNAYKSKFASVDNKTGLTQLLVETREGQDAAAAKQLGFEEEWQIFYQREGMPEYMIASTGLVFSANTPMSMDTFDAMTRSWLPNRVSSATLTGLQTEAKRITSLSIPQVVLLSGSKRGPKTTLHIRLNYNEPFTYSAKSNQWGSYSPEFSGLLHLLEKAIGEAA